MRWGSSTIPRPTPRCARDPTRLCRVGREDLRGATLYSTLQPGGMCTMASIWAHIGRIVYGAGWSDVHRMVLRVPASTTRRTSLSTISGTDLEATAVCPPHNARGCIIARTIILRARNKETSDPSLSGVSVSLTFPLRLIPGSDSCPARSNSRAEIVKQKLLTSRPVLTCGYPSIAVCVLRGAIRCKQRSNTPWLPRFQSWMCPLRVTKTTSLPPSAFVTAFTAKSGRTSPARMGWTGRVRPNAHHVCRTKPRHRRGVWHRPGGCGASGTRASWAFRCNASPNPMVLDPLPAETTGEISRFALDPRPLGPQQRGRCPDAPSPDPGHRGRERRGRADAPCAIMEKTLLRLLRSTSIYFTAVGPAIEITASGSRRVWSLDDGVCTDAAREPARLVVPDPRRRAVVAPDRPPCSRNASPAER